VNLRPNGFSSHTLFVPADSSTPSELVDYSVPTLVANFPCVFHAQGLQGAPHKARLAAGRGSRLTDCLTMSQEEESKKIGL
jgi:hypothetical protein